MPLLLIVKPFDIWFIRLLEGGGEGIAQVSSLTFCCSVSFFMCAEGVEETQPGLMLLFIDQVTKQVKSETVDDLKMTVWRRPCPSPEQSATLKFDVGAICRCSLHRMISKQR